MREARPDTVGPDAGPESPYPVRLSGKIISGFGRGSKELGIPTANIPTEGLPEFIESGIYYGWAGLQSSECGSSSDKGDAIFPMVMSVGWNPFYKNTVRSVEVHIIHKFPQDFYGAHLNLLIMGYIRPEFDYISKEALIEDINKDIDIAVKSLERPPYAQAREESCLSAFPNPN
ncbi:riboflavin kinase [Arthrobotrys musiformis]|uniref:Riboflavin kinase n=1 Tax=Arthrobotrys musiformis TaxID=47236 RepID=A0AAV9WI13_9PEZI